MNKDYVETVPAVYVDGEWIPTTETEFVDIAEDLQGYDVMTFNYKGKQSSSRVRMIPA